MESVLYALVLWSFKKLLEWHMSRMLQKKPELLDLLIQISQEERSPERDAKCMILLKGMFLEK